MDRTEKLAVAVKVSLYYITIVTIVSAFSNAFSNLLFVSSDPISALGIGLPRFVVSVAVILALAVLSYVLNKNGRGRMEADHKAFVYSIVGVLIIVNGITSIPTQVIALRIFLQTLSNIDIGFSQQNKVLTENGIYAYIIPMVMYVIQMGLGIYYILTANKLKQGE